MGYQKLLVAFDGSEGSLKALDHGIQYAKENGAELTVVNVVKKHKKKEPISTGRTTNSTFMAGGNGMYQLAPRDINARAERTESIAGISEEQKEERVQAEGEDVLSEARNELKGKNLQYKTAVMEGDAAEEIDRYAIAHEMDLVVIGHRGLSGLKKLVLGSVSQKVVEKTHCSVLVVK